MDIVKAVKKMVKNSALSSRERAYFFFKIRKIKRKLTINPSDKNKYDKDFLNMALSVLFSYVETLYGERSDLLKIYPYPIFGDYRGSQIVPLMNYPHTVAIVVGVFAKTWEQVFYELSHECVHLLDPVLDVKNNPVSSLEEGVAVKFAEKIYSEYITPYTKQPPVYSPVLSFNPYFLAFNAVKHVPDFTLKKVREKFHRFSKIDDLKVFKDLVKDAINDKDIEILHAPFKYPS